MTKRIEKLVNKALQTDIFPKANPIAYSDDDLELTEPVRIAKRLGEYLQSQPVCVDDEEELSCGMRFYTSVTNDIYLRGGHAAFSAFRPHHSDDSLPENKLAFTDWNHFCPNYQFIVSQGFHGLKEKINESRVTHTSDAEKQAFLDGLELMCDGVRKWAEKIADVYEEHGKKQIAKRCRRVPYYGATDFHEAVQAVWFTFLLLPDSLGRLDQVLFPFYKKEIDEGTITEEKAYELLCEFFIKVFSFHNRKENTVKDRSGDNTLVIGGYLQDGTDGFNSLSRMILRAIAELPIHRPQLSFRWTRKTPQSVLLEVTECNRKNNNIVFTSDDAHLKAFMKMGIPYEDAVNYTMIGCNEWAIMGKSHTGSDGFFNPVRSLTKMLKEIENYKDAINTFDEFYKCYEKYYLSEDVEYMMNLADEFHNAQKSDMNVLSSLLIDGCIEKGVSITNGGALYNASCWALIGLTNLADSLSVIRQFVFEEKRISLVQLSKMLEANWNGFEEDRRQILQDGHFWGNGESDTDQLVNKILSSLDSMVSKRVPAKGGKFLFGSYVGYNSAHITMGSDTGATPDGRYKGECFPAGIAPSEGKAKSGLTAQLLSSASVDSSLLAGPTAVNLRLEKSLGDTPEKLQKLSQMFQVYFEMGGLQLQPDYLSAQDLLNAQINPNDYLNLRVRVTGFSGYFVRFDKALQDEIIHRTEQSV